MEFWKLSPFKATVVIGTKMSTIEILDFLVGIVWLAVVPFVLAAYGGHLAAQTLTEHGARRRSILFFWGLCVIGIMLATFYQYRLKTVDDARELRTTVIESERQRKLDDAQHRALEAQLELKALEKANGDQIAWMQKRMDRLMAQTQLSDRTNSAQEIKKDLVEMSNKLKEQATITQPIVVLAPLPIAQEPPPRPSECRADSLKICTDEDLLRWGKPLVEKVTKIESDHMAALDALENVTGNWAGFLFGKDKDSKWVKAYTEAQQNTADEFRNCCAENALNYHYELTSRLEGGLQNNDAYDWVRQLLKPVKSKDWKQARSEARAIVRIAYDLDTLQINLNIKMIQATMPKSAH
jgi:hypothetical protein